MMKEKLLKHSKKPSGKLDDLLPPPMIAQQIKRRLRLINERVLRELEPEQEERISERKRASG